MIRVEFRDSRRHAFSPREQAAVRHICESVELEVRVLLPRLPAMLQISVDDSSAVIPEYGATGSALDRARVRWTVDATRPGGVLGVARAHLRAMLFHELHHVVRGWVKAGGGATLLDSVVSEGLASPLGGLPRRHLHRRPRHGTRPALGGRARRDAHDGDPGVGLPT